MAMAPAARRLRMLPELRERFLGLERLDSLSFDPHKWLAVPYDAGCLLVRDAEKLRRTFSLNAPYLRGLQPSVYDGLDFLEYGPEMSRGFRALKVWMTLRHLGLEGLRATCAPASVRRAARTSWSPRIRISRRCMSPCSSILLPLSAAGPRGGEHDEYLDQLNQEIAEQVQRLRTGLGDDHAAARPHGAAPLDLLSAHDRT